LTTTKALYIDSWREGLHSDTELNALASYCTTNGITDVFVQHKVDKATVKRIKIDKFDHLSKAKTILPKTHVWIPVLLLYRTKNAIEVAEECPKFEHKGITYINPLLETSRKYIVKQVSDLLKKHDSVHLDRFWWPLGHVGNTEAKKEALTDIIKRIRKGNPKKYISIYTLLGEQGCNDYKLWLKEGYINKAWVNLSFGTEETFDSLIEEFNDVVIGINQTERLKKCEGKNVALYSYGVRDGK
jgi:hypothetical protein